MKRGPVSELEPEGRYLGRFGARRAYKTYKTPAGGLPAHSGCARAAWEGLRRGDRDAGHWNPCFGDSGVSAVGLESTGASRGDPRRWAQHPANPCRTVQHGAPRRQRRASDARLGTASSNSGTWNSIIFSGLPIGTSIPVRVAFPGAHGGCADRYARFWLMTMGIELRSGAVAGQPSLSTAHSGHTNCGARRFHDSVSY